MTNTLAFNHLFKAFLFRLTIEHSCSTVPVPKPIPAKEWTVIPPMLHAAIPVDAVTAMESSLLTNFLRKAAIISRRRTDFPVPESRTGQSKMIDSSTLVNHLPALPVKKMFFPCSSTMPNTCCCSILRKTLFNLPDFFDAMFPGTQSGSRSFSLYATLSATESRNIIVSPRTLSPPKEQM